MSGRKPSDCSRAREMGRREAIRPRGRAIVQGQSRRRRRRSARAGSRPAVFRRGVCDLERSRRCARRVAVSGRTAALARPPLPIPGGGRGWERGCCGAVRRPTRRTPPVPLIEPSARGKASVPGPGTQACATVHGAAQALSVPCGNGGLLGETNVLRTAACMTSQCPRSRAQTPRTYIRVYAHMYCPYSMNRRMFL